MPFILTVIGVLICVYVYGKGYKEGYDDGKKEK